MSDLHLIGAVPKWLIAGLALLMLGLLVQQFFSLRRRLSAGQSCWITALRASVYGLLLFFMFGPALVEERVTRLRRPLAVLIDGSQSMGLPLDSDRAGPTRLEAVKEKLTSPPDPLIGRLARDFELRLFKFGTDLEPITPEGLSAVAPQAPGTRLAESLEVAARENGGRGAILVFSDGIANGGPTGPSEAAPDPGVPVFSVYVGEARGYTDFRVVEVRAPEFAFRGREIKLDVIVEAFGLKGKVVPLYFNRGRNLVATRPVEIDADAFEKKITLSFTPTEIGSHHFSVSAPLQPGERMTENNQKHFEIDVRRDKIRILTLSGSPAWNYRFLRMAMKQDPLIDLVSFVFLRTPTDSVDVPDNQLSLIPFPIDDIFLEELKNFDVLVLDDFSHRAYFNPVYLERVRDFVRDGGGLAVFGGARAFDSGGYAETALKEILPVELDAKGAYHAGGSIQAKLTPAGKAHPVTRLTADPRANEAIWAGLPPVTAINRVARARGETLLSAARDGSPLLVVGRFGKGRTLALMTDHAWRWNFIAVGNRESPQHHLRFVRQAVRWLAQEPSFEQVQLRPIPRARPGEPVGIRARVLNDDYTPARQAAVKLRVIGPEGDVTPLETAPDRSDGEYRGEFVPNRQGSYRVEAEASLRGKMLGRDRAGFTVSLPSTETEDGRPRPELLEQIAAATGGSAFSIDQWNEAALEKIAARLEEREPSQTVERRQRRLWSTAWTFSLALGLLATEWWMRRKWGLT